MGNADNVGLAAYNYHLLHSNDAFPTIQILSNTECKVSIDVKYALLSLYYSELNSNPFANIKQKIQNHLAQIKKTPQTMDHPEFMKFIKTLQVRCKKEEKFAMLKSVTSDQWKRFISKFNSIQYSESDFTEMGRRKFGMMFRNSIASGSVIKLFKVMTDTLAEIHQKQFSTKKEELSQLDCSELIGLILSALKKDNIDGAALINLDDAYIVNNYIKPWEADFKYFL